MLHSLKEIQILKRRNKYDVKVPDRK